MKNWFYRVKNIFYPDRFQGWGRTKSYFEGWYFKLVDETGDAALAVIPGVAMDGFGKQHAFIQVLDGRKKTSNYHRFSFEDFRAIPDAFEVSIKSNKFSSAGIELDLPELKGSLEFLNPVAWPNPVYAPGIMGPFSFVPFMECYHGIVSMDHGLTGTLILSGQEINFENGRGYIEKDWGHSFPSAYIWMQSNHFSRTGISIKLSVAKIPWLTGSFTGFICGIWINDQLIRFTTYNRSALKKCFVDQAAVSITLESPDYLLEVNAIRDHATQLAAPIRGFMDGRIEESMSAKISVRLIERGSDNVILQDIGLHAGLEVAGLISELFI
jgi:tocopherol cyclase